jgi:hypothetical protein
MIAQLKRKPGCIGFEEFLASYGGWCSGNGG